MDASRIAHHSVIDAIDFGDEKWDWTAWIDHRVKDFRADLTVVDDHRADLENGITLGRKSGCFQVKHHCLHARSLTRNARVNH